MRLLWTFFAGVTLALATLIASLPVLGGAAAITALTRGDLWTILSGQSYFAVRESQGSLNGRVVNVEFHPLALASGGDPRPRSLVARLEVTTTEFAAAAAEGRVRLDVWPIQDRADLRKPPLYRLLVPGKGAVFDPAGVLMVDRAEGRHTAYSLSDGTWLFDADAPVASFVLDGDRHRFAALAQADEDMAPGAVAVLTYSSPQRVIRRLLIRADDPFRASFLRGAVAMVRPIARVEDSRSRTLEITMPAGSLRIGLGSGDDLDLQAVEVPAGLSLSEIQPWRGGPPVATPIGIATPAPAVTPSSATNAAHPALTSPAHAR